MMLHRAAALALLGLTVLTGSLFAQERIVVLSEPGTPIVATEILLAVGPIDEPDSQAGIAHLAARSVIARVRPALDSIGARATVSAQKDALSLSVTAAPDVWEDATRLVLVAMFREPVDSASVMRERRAIVAELRGRVANPADAATREQDEAYFGAAHPWGRPTVGTPETVERLTFAQVDAFVEDAFTPDRAYAAVVGPTEVVDARDHLRSLIGTVFPAPAQLIPFRPIGRTVRREYNSITTWISASYPFTETADEEGLRFAVFLVADALSFSPSQRSVYNVWSDVVPRVGGGEARIQLVIPPEEVSQWTDRLEETIAGLGTATMHDDVFDGSLRRYTGDRIMRLIAPEDRAHEAARQLLVRGRLAGVIPEFSDMTQERLRAAARLLSSPTLVILGPTVD